MNSIFTSCNIKVINTVIILKWAILPNENFYFWYVYFDANTFVLLHIGSVI